VFVLGMPRSGTTLVEQILASHPEVAAGGELAGLQIISRELPFRPGMARPYPECARDLDPEAAGVLAHDYLDRLARRFPEAARITDKMPVNFRYLGLIATLFPAARVIHCRRHPLDACFSIYAQGFGDAHAYACDLGDIAFYYRLYERLMDHWRQVLPMPVHAVDYESLTADLETGARSLVDFCGLAWNDRCLKPHETRRRVGTASWSQVRRPVYRSSVERWRRFAPWLGELRAAFPEWVPDGGEGGGFDGPSK
jgi:hypothetical protein